MVLCPIYLSLTHHRWDSMLSWHQGLLPEAVQPSGMQLSWMLHHHQSAFLTPGTVNMTRTALRKMYLEIIWSYNGKAKLFIQGIQLKHNFIFLKKDSFLMVWVTRWGKRRTRENRHKVNNNNSQQNGFIQTMHAIIVQCLHVHHFDVSTCLHETSEI